MATGDSKRHGGFVSNRDCRGASYVVRGESASHLHPLSCAQCQVAKILLHQHVYNHGILSKPIRASLTEFLRAAQTIPDHTQSTGDDSRLFIRASRACAWFIASTCAISPQERSECLKGLNACGNEKVFRENAKAIQAMWEEVDEKGRPPADWRVFLDQIKANIVFL